MQQCSISSIVSLAQKPVLYYELFVAFMLYIWYYMHINKREIIYLKWRKELYGPGAERVVYRDDRGGA